MKRFLTMMLLAYSFSTVYADAISVEELKSIQSKFKAYDHLSVDFKQTKFVSIRPTRPIESSGSASFSKPGKFKWVTKTKSGEDVAMYDGQNLMQYKGNTGNRYKSTGERSQELNRIVDLVLNFETLLQNYRPVRQERKGDLIELELEPKMQVGDLEKIQVKYDLKKNLLTYLKMNFKDKNSSIYEFSNPSTKSIDQATYTPPSTVKFFDVG